MTIERRKMLTGRDLSHILRDMNSLLRAALLAAFESVVRDRECITRDEILTTADELSAVPALAELARRVRSSAARLERLPVSAVLAAYDADGLTLGCVGARAGNNHHSGWVCLRPAVDRADGVGLVRVACRYCGHEFEIEYEGSLGGRVFAVPEHAPAEVRYHGPAHVRELAGRA